MRSPRPLLLYGTQWPRLLSRRVEHEAPPPNCQSSRAWLASGAGQELGGDLSRGEGKEGRGHVRPAAPGHVTGAGAEGIWTGSSPEGSGVKWGGRGGGADNGECAAAGALASGPGPTARGGRANGGPGPVGGAEGSGRTGAASRAGSRVRPVWPPRDRGRAGGAASSRFRRGPSTCGRLRALLAMSEPLPAFLDRLWGPWLGTRTPPLRGLSAASPSKVASPSAPSGQPGFPSGGVTRESPSSGLVGVEGTGSLSGCHELDKLRFCVCVFLFNLDVVTFFDVLTPVQP